MTTDFANKNSASGTQAANSDLGRNEGGAPDQSSAAVAEQSLLDAVEQAVSALDDPEQAPETGTGLPDNLDPHFDFLSADEVLLIDGEPVNENGLPAGISLERNDEGEAVIRFDDQETETLHGASYEQFLDFIDGIVASPDGGETGPDSTEPYILDASQLVSPSASDGENGDDADNGDAASQDGPEHIYPAFGDDGRLPDPAEDPAAPPAPDDEEAFDFTIGALPDGEGEEADLEEFFPDYIHDPAEDEHNDIPDAEFIDAGIFEIPMIEFTDFDDDMGGNDMIDDELGFLF
jgi:hypothetical protein